MLLQRYYKIVVQQFIAVTFMIRSSDVLSIVETFIHLFHVIRYLCPVLDREYSSTALLYCAIWLYLSSRLFARSDLLQVPYPGLYYCTRSLVHHFLLNKGFPL